MPKPLTLKQFASLGGKARAAKLSKERLTEIAREAGKASWQNRKPKEASKQASGVPE